VKSRAPSSPTNVGGEVCDQEVGDEVRLPGGVTTQMMILLPFLNDLVPERRLVDRIMDLKYKYVE
jgi:hypothetical protein